MLEQTFIGLLTNYTDDTNLKVKLWEEVKSHYSTEKRYYHTLAHLDNLLQQLTEVQSLIHNWQVSLFTLYYHDIIYNSLKSNNEFKSALLAEKRMQQVSVPLEVIALCKQQILATKSHLKSENEDTNYFTDADLSVLGQSWQNYSRYTQNVRKEYSIYPNLFYKNGRKKVIKHFLGMERIFKTEYFYTKFEDQAKENLQKEIEML